MVFRCNEVSINSLALPHKADVQERACPSITRSVGIVAGSEQIQRWWLVRCCAAEEARHVLLVVPSLHYEKSDIDQEKRGGMIELSLPVR